MKELNFAQMEDVEAGRRVWLEAACIAGGIALGLATSGPAVALTASFAIHACLFYVLDQVEV